MLNLSVTQLVQKQWRLALPFWINLIMLLFRIGCEHFSLMSLMTRHACQHSALTSGRVVNGLSLIFFLHSCSSSGSPARTAGSVSFFLQNREKIANTMHLVTSGDLTFYLT